MTLLNIKTLFTTAVISTYSIVTIAQQQTVKIVCGNAILMEQMERKYPGYTAEVNNTFNTAKLNTTSVANRKTNANPVINVVVHVVWKDSTENLADSIIQSQIQVLNEDFNRLNADTTNLRAIFNPIAGSAGITFNLYQTIRTKTTVDFTPSFAGIPNEMKYDSTNGSNALNPDNFLNIWVCKLQPITFNGVPLGQILGFAYPPANLSNWPAGQAAPNQAEDGVVIDYRVFGRNNPNTVSVDGVNNLVVTGRTPVHEVGHYLGLRHIWGDGGSPFGGGNNCTGNDGIADTPKASDQSQFNCDTTRNTCIDTLPWTTIDAPDMIENYMDYSSETCMNTFTKGQDSLMNAVLQGPRNGLINNTVGGFSKTQLFVNIYPNPAQDKITVTATEPITQLELYTMLGSKVTLTANTTYLNTRDVANGTYLLKIATANSSKIVRVVVSN